MTPIPHPRERQFNNSQNSLVLNEPFMQVQPGLKAVFGDDEADIIQQIVYWRNHPYRDLLLDLEFKFKKFEDRLYVRIPPGLMFNPWSGKLRHIHRETYKKKLGSCRKQGVIWTADLNTEKGDNVNWYHVVSEVLDPLTGLYQEALDQVQNERWEARLSGNALGDAREQELLEEYQQRHAQKIKELTEDGWIPGRKHYEKSDVRRAIERGRGQISPAPVFQGTGEPEVGADLQGVGAVIPDIQGQNDLVCGVDLTSLSSVQKSGTENEVSHKQHQAPLAVVVDSNESVSTPDSATLPPFPQSSHEPRSPRPPRYEEDEGALPAVITSDPGETSPTIEFLATRLYELAPEVLTLEMARRRAATWSEAGLSDQALRARLGRLGIGRQSAKMKQIVEGYAMNARWQLVFWHHWPESKQEYCDEYNRRRDPSEKNLTPAGALITRILHQQEPPDTWVREIVADVQREAYLNQPEEEREKAAQQALQRKQAQPKTESARLGDAAISLDQKRMDTACDWYIANLSEDERETYECDALARMTADDFWRDRVRRNPDSEAVEKKTREEMRAIAYEEDPAAIDQRIAEMAALENETGAARRVA